MPPTAAPTQQRIALAIAAGVAASLASLVVLAACHRGPPLPAGDIAASLTSARPIDGRAYDAAALRGKPSLVLFMTPTCSHCLATLPRAAAAASSRGANVVAVFVTGKASQAASVVAYAKFTGPALLDDGTLLKRYAVDHVPYALVLGPDGTAKDALIGEQTESELGDALASAR